MGKIRILVGLFTMSKISEDFEYKYIQKTKDLNSLKILRLIHQLLGSLSNTIWVGELGFGCKTLWWNYIVLSLDTGQVGVRYLKK